MDTRAGLWAMIAAMVTASSIAASAQGGTKHEGAKPAPSAHATPASAAPVKPAKPMTRREEIEHAIATRKVPERYRSSVPKEYQKYIPFAKGR